MEARRRRVRVAKAEFRVGQHVRISIGKMKFAKSAEQNFNTEIFRIAKVIERRPRPLYELKDSYTGAILSRKLTRVRVTRRTVYKIDKILNKRVRRGILEYLVRWRGYSKDFDSWVPASSAKKKTDIQRRS